MRASIGDTVLYTLQHRGDMLIQYPAMVTSIEDDYTLNLAAFYDHKAATQNFHGHPTSVPYSGEAKAHTWMFSATRLAHERQITSISTPPINVVINEKPDRKRKGKKR